jgi:mRNA-degrading endonuclease RelE of RelBE toxin-antitoxin system
MKTEVRVTKGFRRQAKPLLKKYPSLKEELFQLHHLLSSNPNTGVEIMPDIFKIRLAVKSKGKGKRGGLRVITFLETVIVAEFEDDESAPLIFVNLIAIYDKSEVENISDSEIIAYIDDMDFGEE